jgi:hypothetical protein
MSALGFLGGLGSFAGNFQKGFEQSEDREQLKKDREYQRQQREFDQGQQKRKLDEQKRADDLRVGDSSVATTEEIDDPNWKPTPATENPVAQVVIGADGSETVTPAQAPQQAPKIKRQRQWDSIYRDYAANRQKAGDTAGAIEFTDKANKIAAQRSANAFMQLQADAGNKTPIELAREIGKIFDADPMNGGTKSIEELPNGGVRMTLYNKDTGQTSTKEFTGEKARDRLLADFNAYFRPEAYAKLLDKRIETQDARAAELLKPYTLRPGEKRQVMGADGKVITIGEGNIPAGYELMTDAQGNTVLRKFDPAKRSGSGGDSDGDGAGGKGKKGKTPLDIATSSVMDAIKESAESKTLNADQLIGVQATARELVANATRAGQELDPFVAGKLALTAVLKPESVKPAYNPATGTFENTVSYNGNTFSVGKVDQAMMPESQLKGVAQAFVNKLPAASRAEYIRAASGDTAALDKIRTDITAAHGKQWSDQFAAVNGRRPTQQDVQASIARTQSIVEQNIRLVSTSGVVEQDKKQRETTARNESLAAAKAAIGTPAQIMALPPGRAAEIYRQYGAQTDGFQREALQRKMQQDRTNMSVGGMRQQ